MPKRLSRSGRGGPTTEAGKARSSRNSVVHGLSSSGARDENEDQEAERWIEILRRQVPPPVDEAAMREWALLRLDLRRVRQVKRDLLALSAAKTAEIAGRARRSQLLHRLAEIRGETFSIRQASGRMPRLDPRSQQEIRADQNAHAVRLLERIHRYEKRIQGRLGVLQRSIWGLPRTTADI